MQPEGETARRAALTRLLANPLLRRVIRNSGYLFSGSTAAAAMSFSSVSVVTNALRLRRAAV